MDFDEAERRYYELRGRLNAGKISPQEYQAHLKELTVRAADGRMWMIGGQTGRWYTFDGKSWVQAEPPRPQVPMSSRPGLPPRPTGAADRCLRCGEPVRPGEMFCERCGQVVGEPPPAPPPPPPVAARTPASPPRATRGARSGWIVAAVGLLLLLGACAALAAVALLLPQSPVRGMLPGAPTATPTATPSPIRRATDTPTATATPAALATPTAAVLSPTATATAKPTPTPTPAATQPAPTATAPPPTSTAAPTLTPTPQARLSGRIAYTIYDPAGRTDNIYVINADGTGATQVVSQGLAPAWAPDGRIAYHSLRSDLLGLVIRYPDGTTRYPKNYEVFHEDQMPSWSPDANRIALAFGSNTASDKPWTIVVLNADGTGRHTLSGFNGRSPSWGPGNLIAFRRVYAQEGLYLVGADGGVPRLLANVGNDTSAAWSPDGARVTFMADKDSNGNWEIYVINADGSGLKNLSNAPGTMEMLPTWLPDGKHIAYRSNQGGMWGLWVMNDDGSGAVRIAQAELDTNRYLEDRMSAQ